MSHYTYNAHVDSVYDGDTITCTIDCGFNVRLRKMKIRLFGLNAPEVRGKERADGIKVRDALRDKVLKKDVVIQTIQDKKGKYGRYLGVVFLGDVNINTWLVESGLAKAASY